MPDRSGGGKGGVCVLVLWGIDAPGNVCENLADSVVKYVNDSAV